MFTSSQFPIFKLNFHLLLKICILPTPQLGARQYKSSVIWYTEGQIVYTFIYSKYLISSVLCNVSKQNHFHKLNAIILINNSNQLSLMRYSSDIGIQNYHIWSATWKMAIKHYTEDKYIKYFYWHDFTCFTVIILLPLVKYFVVTVPSHTASVLQTNKETQDPGYLLLFN